MVHRISHSASLMTSGGINQVFIDFTGGEHVLPDNQQVKMKEVVKNDSLNKSTILNDDFQNLNAQILKQNRIIKEERVADEKRRNSNKDSKGSKD